MADPRTGLLRTKTGCLTCRVRRVKCDETKPMCIRCTKTGRHCDGYSSVPISRRELIARQFPDPNFSAFERKCFELFRLRTAKADWDMILQLTHIEPSIRHGVLALGSLHHEFENDAASSLRSYDKAVQYTRSLRDTNKILAACVIFTCFENINGNYAMACMHLKNGLAIARQTHAEDDIVEILHRLEFQAMTFADAGNPFPWLRPRVLAITIPYFFETPRDARTAMVDIQRWAMSVMEAYQANDRSETIVAAREACRQKLREWKAAFDRSKHEHWIPMPKLYWILATLMIEPGCEVYETAWDDHYDLLETATNCAAPLAKIRSFSLELGTTVPLFCVATKARNPQLRRRAIELLRTPRQEGIWYSPAASRIAEKVMQFEERGKTVNEAKDIPESARVRTVYTEFIPGQRVARVKLVVKSGSEWVCIEDLVSY